MNKTIELLENQKTTRAGQFSDRSVPDEAVNTIKKAITKTANASNRQSYSIIELDSKKTKSLGLAGNRAFVFCIDFYRLHRLAEKLGKTFDSTYIMQFTTALTDISMLAQSTIIAARSLGIDTLITNEIYHTKLGKVFNELKLPSEHAFPLITVCLGYSDLINPEKHGRIKEELIFHQNEYKKITETELEKLITEYDDPQNHLGLIENWAEKGFNHYLEWFFDKWSRLIGSKKQSEVFETTLKDAKII